MKKLISLFLVLTLVLSMAPMVHAETKNGSCGDYAKWEFNTETGVLRIYGEGDVTVRAWKEYKWAINTVIVEPGITSIVDNAFYEGWYITSITLPDTVTKIGKYAFYDCPITSIDLPESLVTIGDEAFRKCGNLQEVRIPDHVKSIGAYAFRYCSSLKTVTLPEGLETIGAWAFDGCSALKSISMPDTVTSIGTGVFSGCSSMTSVKLSNSLTVVPERAFQGCSSLVSVILPEGLKSIGMCAFSNNSSLKHIKLPETLTLIGDIAFGWSGLEQLIIPASVTKISTGSVGNNAFADCGNLKRIAVLNPDCNLVTSSLGVVGTTTVYCYKESTAHRYAVNKGYAFEFITEDNLWEDYNDEAPYENPFTDITNSGDYYYTPVLWAYATGITSGTTATTFGPSENCLRGQVVTFLHRSLNDPETTIPSCPFVDVAQSMYYYTPILWAYETGVTKGTDATHFSPEDTVTRAQFVTFLWRAAGEPEPTAKSSFSDVSSGEYYYKAVCWAVENGITQGTGNGQFSPNDTCLREHVVTFLYRFLAD